MSRKVKKNKQLLGEVDEKTLRTQLAVETFVDQFMLPIEPMGCRQVLRDVILGALYRYEPFPFEHAYILLTPFMYNPA